MGNPYEIRPLGGLDLGGGIAQLGDRYRQSRDVKEQKQAQQAQAQQMQAEKLRQQEVLGAASKYYQEGNTDGLAELMIQNPALADQMQKSVNFVSDVSRKDSAQTAFKSLMQLHGGGSVNTLAAGRAERVMNEGGDPTDTINAAKITDRAEQIREYEMQLMVSDPSMWKMYKEQTAKPEGATFQQGTGDVSGLSFNPATGEYSESQAAKRFMERKGGGVDEIPSEVLAQVPDSQKPAAAAAFKAAGGGEKGLNAANKLIDRGVKAQEKEAVRITSAESMISQAETINALVSRIKSSKGFSSAVGAKGASSLFGLLDSPMGGSAAADVVADLGTLEAKNFLTSIKAFKDAGGAGSLSDSEGKKLAAALASLDRDQSEANLFRNLEVVEKLTGKMMKDANKILGRKDESDIDDIGRLGTQSLSDKELLSKYGG